jgi:multidrug efflux pump subunit AcrA (membrane-fusion protein)
MLLGRNTLSVNRAFTVRKTNFEQVITVKGEIQGKNAVFITFPDELKERDLWVRDFQIKDLIQEGKLVKKGDWVATLDVDNLSQQMQQNNDEIERRLADFNDQKIDSAIDLTGMREELKELKYDLEYRELDLEQSKYESPAYQRKMKVAYNKTIRQIDKKRRDYELRRMNLAMRTKRSEDRYNFSLYRDSLLRKAIEAATITAPQDGMVMYARTRGGRKIRVGDNVSQWNPAIASLPDLSTLISETYVEEIQITKIQIGDSVAITVDAIPGRKYSGSIYKIANIGQELSNFESKVFNVLIEIHDSDASLKPAMTSNNNIIMNSQEEVLTIPRECLFTENNENFVFLKKSGKVYKQPVTAGLENDLEIIIESGLEEKDKVLYKMPENVDEIELHNRITSRE